VPEELDSIADDWNEAYRPEFEYLEDSGGLPEPNAPRSEVETLCLMSALALQIRIVLWSCESK
jgi:hypothetical protein